MAATEVTLKNGKSAPDVAVRAIMLNLGKCLEDQPIAFYEMACVCRDREHVPFGNTGEILRSRGLLESSGQPHEVVRDVVLSAVTGEDFDLHLGEPCV
jgi:hypothetical protein